MSLAQIQEAPEKGLILLAGAPGAGKSSFCHQVVLNSLAAYRPVIFVTTERSASDVVNSLRDKGLGETLPGALRFVDAFSETVGLTPTQRSDTVHANCADLNSLSITITKLQARTGRRGNLLVLDSLTSPYLFHGAEVVRFAQLFLSKFAAEGNAVFALMDEGCGKEEDLVAMMSAADGILRLDIEENSRVLNVVKHPEVEPTQIKVPMIGSPVISYQFNVERLAQHMQMIMGLMAGPPLRAEVGDSVNLFWPNFARWSCMLWGPQRFPTMTYNSNKQMESDIREFIKFLPWHTRLLLQFMPKDFSRVKDMKRILSFLGRISEGDRTGIGEYVESASKTNEHYLRVYESDMCWGFENVGAALYLGILGGFAGVLKGFERDRGGPDRDWNIVETRCVGLGDPYCEFKLVPGEIDELQDSLEAIDSTVIKRIHGRLMDRLMGFMLHGKPLWERPRLGNEISLHQFGHIVVLPAIVSERYRMAMRLGGAMGGKEVGQHLMKAGVEGDEAVQRVMHLLEYCKVGKVSMDEMIRIQENCESFAMRSEEPSCFFTTGFLNGLFSSVKEQHVREVKCIAVGDPYCEWEIV
jgi:predicted hydrocarbon binding protein/KaiC/GvpD/RAD55 family RecA-like ATPase